jgi:hypothetical protein
MRGGKGRTIRTPACYAFTRRFVFRIEGHGSCRQLRRGDAENHCLLLWNLRSRRERVCPRTRIAVRVRQQSVSGNAVSAEPDNCLALHTEFSAKQFFADRPPASTELLRRAAETDRGVASLP